MPDIFDTAAIARRYSVNRPFFHPVVIDRIRTRLKPPAQYRYGLDVGCGAGLSTVALKALCERVIGIDSSKSMVSSAIEHDGITYFPYAAEHIPLEERFNIITLSGSIDWIDRPVFFNGAARLLDDDGYVVIYDNDFTGRMQDVDAFADWYASFGRQYPRPARNSSPLRDQDMRSSGLRLMYTEKYENVVEYDLAGFIAYLFTLSNITAVLPTSDEQELKESLIDAVRPFFNEDKRRLVFGGYIWYVR